LTKIPDCTDTFVVVLIVVVLVAIVEILFPGVVRTVLRRTPIVVVRKATNKLNKGVNARIAALVSLVVVSHSLYRFSYKTMPTRHHRGSNDSGFYGCALRHPVI
jgi:membrane protein implicated in regulation of membrane protease activity